LAEVDDLNVQLNSHEELDLVKTPEPLYTRSPTKENRQKTDELEAEVDRMTLEKWQLTEEIQDLKAHYELQLKSVCEQARQDTAALQSNADRLQQELKGLVDELADERTKVASERERRRQLMNEMHVKEDTVERLQESLDSLGKTLAFGQKKIEKLESEINREADDEYDYSERVKELTRLNSQLTNRLRERDTELQDSENERNKLEGALLIAQREAKKAQYDRKEQSSLAKRLEEELEGAKEQLRLRDERLVSIKADLQQEMTSRILELRHEKMVLEERLDELEESANHTLRSIDLSMHDELASLDDFRPTRLSTPKDNRLSTPREFRSLRQSQCRFFGENKQVDSLKVEIGEKEYLIKTLRTDKEGLEKKIEDMHGQVYALMSSETRLKEDYEQQVSSLTAELKAVKGKYKQQTEQMDNEIMELRADIEKLQKQTLRSAEFWADECNKLRAELSTAEQAAITAKLQYAQSATDLEILVKKFNDSKVKKKRFSLFRRSKAC
jgi:chromosome segregation ATPase